MTNNELHIYAPVVIPTLCRYEHLKRCIDTLSECTGADGIVCWARLSCKGISLGGI